MRVMSRVFASVMCLSFLLSSVPASAQSVSSTDISGYSVEQLEQLIAKLQKQLEELKKGTQCYVSDQELSVGDGEDGALTDHVRRLQNFLREKGYFSYKDTGYFGKATRAALMAFQKAQGLPASGVLDDASRAKMHGMFCKKVVAKKMEEKKYYEEKKYDEKKYEEKKSGVVNAIKLKSSGNAVYWAVDGYSKMGFKLVWSRTPNPVYPLRENDKYQYFDNPMQSEAKLEAYAGSGTYYVRVCEYLGGACGVYSNEIEVQL